MIPDKPSAMWYAIGALIVLTGFAASVTGAIHDVRATESAFVRFVAPGAVDLRLANAGLYILYYERTSVIDGEMFDTPDATDIRCSVTDSATGQDITLEPVALATEYELSGRSGKSIAQFSVPALGTYVMRCDHPSGSGPRIALSVSPPVAANLATSLFRWLAVAFVSLAVGIIVLIVTLVRRSARGTPV